MTERERQRIERMVFMHIEAQRRHEERQRNRARLVDYNRRRIAAGLAPLELPSMTERMILPGHRDHFHLWNR
jgi:hypothetical protein